MIQSDNVSFVMHKQHIIVVETKLMEIPSQRHVVLDLYTTKELKLFMLRTFAKLLNA